jgi:hypothetical protein
VAQHVLEFVESVDSVVYFRRFLAGFTITAPDPIYSVCNCQRNDNIPPGTDEEEAIGACRNLKRLFPYGEDGNCTRYSECFPDDCMEEINETLCHRTGDEGCYVVDGFSADSIQVRGRLGLLSFNWVVCCRFPPVLQQVAVRPIHP